MGGALSQPDWVLAASIQACSSLARSETAAVELPRGTYRCPRAMGYSWK